MARTEYRCKLFHVCLSRAEDGAQGGVMAMPDASTAFSEKRALRSMHGKACMEEHAQKRVHRKRVHGKAYT